MSRFALSATLCLAAVAFAAAPASACEFHQSHAVLASESAAPPSPPSTPAPAMIIVEPASAAAMSVAEGLGTEPPAMRCHHRMKQEALTQ
jgi:hypothetical protein